MPYCAYLEPDGVKAKQVAIWEDKRTHRWLVALEVGQWRQRQSARLIQFMAACEPTNSCCYDPWRQSTFFHDSLC